MRIPSATYRVQFNLNFRYNDATALVPYLHDLGISHLYASPRFKARKGSSHGYDCTDPAQINSELGTEEEFNRLVERLRQYGMGFLLDIVPNHMATSAENPWWMDLLENGQSSAYSSFFDIDWHSQRPKLSVLQQNRVLIPVLGGDYNQILLNQGIQLRLDEKGFFVQYEDHRFPIAPTTYAEILDDCAEALQKSNHPSFSEFQSLVESARTFSNSAVGRGGPLPDATAARTEIKNRLWQLYSGPRGIRRALDETLLQINGVKGQQQTFHRLDSLLSRQVYRLAHWRVASEELNYRRFFNINDLIGLREEEPIVFAARHAEIVRLIQEGKVSALRIDHIDGLRDPLQYLQRIQAAKAPTENADSDKLNIYTIVEKITSGDETLPSEWPVAGTTGYDFLNAVNALFVDEDGFRELERFYREFSGLRATFSEIAYVRKKQVMEELFPSDISRLTYLLAGIAALEPQGRDIPVRELKSGLLEITACLPVYRTYYRDPNASAQDRVSLQAAFSAARDCAPLGVLSEAAFDFLRQVFFAELSLRDASARNMWCDFILSWQQFSGAVMAKGLEDTALFVHHVLLSLNEVGDKPSRKNLRFSVDAFHQFNARSLERHPHTLNATSTHDTKWSEDFRVRIDVLSEMPDEWRKRLVRWNRWNRSRKTKLDGRLVPSSNEEVLLYQAMLGIWPLENPNVDELKQRIETFFMKAVREAKTHTSWMSPNEKHEAALREFISSILDAPDRNRFLSDFRELQERLAFYGVWNACSQLVLKMTSPGVPDFFQGNELWNFRLTDPDNRQPVDFASRVKLLEELKAHNARSCPEFLLDLVKHWRDGRLKLFLTMRGLNLRRAYREVFMRGDYAPLRVQGKHAKSVCAFVRHHAGTSIVVAVPRLLTRVVAAHQVPTGPQAWGDSSLVLPSAPSAVWTNLFTGESIPASNSISERSLPLGKIFESLPFAVIVNGPPTDDGTAAR
ncbi:MAG: malto-oligosyltrehalose synthase [Candidatus Acidiferrales bacterium]